MLFVALPGICCSMSMDISILAKVTRDAMTIPANLNIDSCVLRCAIFYHNQTWNSFELVWMQSDNTC